MLNENIEAFMVYVSLLKLKINIYPAKKAYLALLFIKKVTISAKYLDFADIFLNKLANVLLKQIDANKYATKLKKGN